MTRLFARKWTSPIGELLAVTDCDQQLKILVMNWPKRVAVLQKQYRSRGLSWDWDPHSARDVEAQLNAYFVGERRDFDLALAPEGTPFQQQVWNELRKIRHGEVLSYGDLATQIGNPLASRGVGAANGANPICIVVPCHRVVGFDGKLTGFAYGVGVKARLLRLEGHRLKSGPMPKLQDFPHRQQPGLFDA